MTGNQFHLLTTQALGALNGNPFKNALIVPIIYQIAEEAGLRERQIHGRGIGA